MKKKIALIIVLILVLAIGLSAYLLLFTAKGSEFIVREALTRFALEENIKVEQVTGTLVKGINFRNIEMLGLRDLPEGSQLKVGELFIKFSQWNIDGLMVRVINARLKMPVSDPIVLNGSFKQRNLDVNIFSNLVDIEEIINIFPNNPNIRQLSGSLKNIDLEVVGKYESPSILGELMVEEIKNKQIKFTNGPVKLVLERKSKMITQEIFGEVIIRKGELQTDKVAIQVAESKIYFSGDPQNPRLRLQGFSRIKRVDINIAINGTAQSPKILLSSEPVLPKEQLLLMVATGQKWEGLSQSIETGDLSNQLAKDFFQYLFWGGSGNKLAEKLGLSDLTISVGKNRSSVGASRYISDNLEVKYQIERENGRDTNNPNVVQKVGSEIRVTNRITLEVEKEFRKPNALSGESDDVQRADILLKYKKSF